MALLTYMIPLLSNAHATNGGNMSGKDCNKVGNDHNGNGDSNRNGSAFSKIEPYRLVCAGDSIEKYGRILYWYPTHNEGKGMYITHRLEDYDEW